MNRLIQRNQQFVCEIFAGKASPPAFQYRPPLIPLAEVGDYTLSDQPVSKWTPWVVENYRRQVDALERHGDDSVPVAKVGTGTQLFAHAFGCKVHIPSGDNPCALPMAASAEEAEKIEMPDIWKSACLYRVFELAEAVRRELGPDTALAPCDLQTGFDIANLIWNKTDLLCSLIENPDAVKRLSAKCALLLKTFLLELRKEFPTMSPCHCPGNWVPPGSGAWVSNDEVGILSPAQFGEFCLPELIDLSHTFGGLGMHCCADAEHQFPGFKHIPNFYAFNRVAASAGPHRGSYLSLLEHFAGPAAPVHCLAWLTDETIEQLLARAPVGTRFIFVQMGGDDALAARWLERGRTLAALRHEGKSLPGVCPCAAPLNRLHQKEET